MNKHDIPNDDIIFVDDDITNNVDRQDDESTRLSIEITHDEANSAAAQSHHHVHAHKWLWIAIATIAATMICIISIGGWKMYCYYYKIGIPISVSCDENIEKLQKPYAKSARPEITLTADSILGVALNMYELKNLQAEISLTEPDSTDANVWMYSRCADHTSDNKYIGTLVAQGKELSTDKSRLGYCAMANGNIVIGVSRSDNVKDYAMKHGGSFFRQFILVSDGVLPATFHLHGKVERRALARMSDDRLFYIESRHQETMWDFADALREYGFTDAIYITGGKCHSFYRTADGKPHSIGDDNQRPHPEYKKIVPWLVFKAR